MGQRGALQGRAACQISQRRVFQRILNPPLGKFLATRSWLNLPARSLRGKLHCSDEYDVASNIWRALHRGGRRRRGGVRPAVLQLLHPRQGGVVHNP